MAFCTSCGAPVSGQFCTKCGARLGTTAPAGAPPPPSPSPQMSSVSPPQQPPVNIPGPKKRGFIFWALLGCGGILVVGLIVIVSASWFVYNKAKQAGFDPALMQSNPALAVAKILVSVNPDLEVLGVDEAAGTIKVKDKKSGQTLIVNLEDAKKGKIVFLDEKGQKVEFEAKGEGDKAGIQIKGPEGTLTMGATAAPLPDWLPSYPGAESMGAFGVNSKEGKGATQAFKTRDAPEDVISFYEGAFNGEGMEVQKSKTDLSGGASMTILAAKDSSGQRSAQVTISGKAGETMINLTFESKK